MYRNRQHADTASTSSGQSNARTSSRHNMASTFVGLQGQGVNMSSFCEACADRRHNRMPPNARKALEGATFIAKHLGGENESKRVRDEWKYVALVIDRILLIIYVSVCVLGGMGILLRAPALYDYRKPLTRNSF
ncbi:Acetylcholine receptor subunit alpha-like [Lamellibrachia satsuma]|nr:Acetylcholine receptor subunit alpha-like [Lamellibrachia satsuma]